MVDSKVDNLLLTFFIDLKKFNNQNFKSIELNDIVSEDMITFKAYSSIITRYFIFKSLHPEISESDMNLLYFKLRIDMLARYFSEYPAGNLDDLKSFQNELRKYAKEMHHHYESKFSEAHVEGGDIVEQNSVAV